MGVSTQHSLIAWGKHFIPFMLLPYIDKLLQRTQQEGERDAHLMHMSYLKSHAIISIRRNMRQICHTHDYKNVFCTFLYFFSYPKSMNIFLLGSCWRYLVLGKNTNKGQ